MAMPVQVTQDATCIEVKQADDVVFTSRSQKFTGGMNGKREIDCIGRRPGRQQLTAAGSPKADSLIKAAADHSAATGAEATVSDRICVPAQGVEQFAALPIPQHHGMIQAAAGKQGRRSYSCVCRGGTKGAASDHTSMSLQSGELLTAQHRPQTEGLVAAATGERTAIGAKGEPGNAAGMPLEGAEGAAAIAIPQAN